MRDLSEAEVLEGGVDEDAEISASLVSVVDVECEGDSLVREGGVVSGVDSCFGTPGFTA